MCFHTHYAVKGRLGRVLVVEDEELIRKPLCLHLRQGGYEVVETTNGEEAITQLSTGDNPLMVDTILCDIRMPRIDGKEAIRYFRSHYPTVPIVVFTGYPDTQLAVSLLKLGVSGYLVKPVSQQELLDVIASSVEKHRILRVKFP
jgi:two-component system chemotaxis response regulator CheY